MISTIVALYKIDGLKQEQRKALMNLDYRTCVLQVMNICSIDKSMAQDVVEILQWQAAAE